MPVEFLLFALTGMSAGFLAGLLGIGGGLVVVPALHFIFIQLRIPSNAVMPLALGTSLGAMVFTAGSSAWSHYRLKGIEWKWFKLLLPGIVLGVILGAEIAALLSGRILELVSGMSFCIIGMHFIFPGKNGRQGMREAPAAVHRLAGVLIGSISSLLGIGGGILSVPYMTMFHVPMKPAISTSAALGFPIAFIGALSYLAFGMNQKIADESIGYLYVPALIIIGLCAACCAPFGAKLAYALPVDMLKKAFGLLLIAAGISFVY